MRRQKVSFRRKVERRIGRKERAYETEQLMKENRRIRSFGGDRDPAFHVPAVWRVEGADYHA